MFAYGSRQNVISITVARQGGVLLLPGLGIFRNSAKTTIVL
jgi:hypothetical protein